MLAQARRIDVHIGFVDEFKKKAEANLAIDGAGDLTYIAPTRVNLDLTMERWPDIEFKSTREHS